MNKLTRITPIIFMLALIFIQIPLAQAQSGYLAVSEIPSAGTGGTNINYDWYNTTMSAGECTSFRPNASGYLSMARLWLRGDSSPTALLYLRVHEAIGTHGVDAEPGELLDWGVIDSATLNSSFAWVNVTFTLNTTYLEQGHDYVLALVSEDNTGTLPHELDGTNNVDWGIRAATSNHLHFHNYDWNDNIAGYGCKHIVYVNTTNPAPSPTPAPTYPSAGGGETYIDYLIGQLVNFFIPLVVMLIPAFLLGYVCRMGKWGYIIGLAIGSGLGYVFIPNFPVWLVFLVSLGIVGFAYSEVKRGN